MTVRELIDALSKMPQDAEVFYDSGLDDDPVTRVSAPAFNPTPDKRLTASWSDEEQEDYDPTTGTVPAKPGVFI